MNAYRAAKGVLRHILDTYVRRRCRLEFEAQSFLRFNERPVEYAFLFRKLAELYPLRVLDVGTGMTALPHLISNCGPLVTATDNVRDYWPEWTTNRHYHVLDDDITETRLKDRFDLVCCISTLEHIKTPEAAVRNMFRLLNPGGSLILTFPYTEGRYVANVYDLPGSSYGRGLPYVAQSYSRRDLDRWLAESDGEIVEQELWRFWSGDFWTVGKQIIPPERASADTLHQLTCVHLRRSAAHEDRTT